MDTRQQGVDAYFFGDAHSHVDCRRDWPRDQTHDSAPATLGANEHTVGWLAFELEIPLVSLRARWSFDRFFCYSIFRKEADWPRLSSHSNFHCIFAHVHWCALFVRRCVRCDSGDSLCAAGNAFFFATNRKSQLANLKLDAEGVRFELNLQSRNSHEQARLSFHENERQKAGA